MEQEEVKIITQYIGVWFWFETSLLTLSLSLFYLSELSLKLKGALSISYFVVFIVCFYYLNKRRKSFKPENELDSTV